MMPRTTIAQITKMIGRELDSGVGPSEAALAEPILAEGGATAEIVGRLLAEAHRKHPDDGMIAAYAFLLEGALATLRLQASGGDVGAEHEIAEVRDRLGDALQKGGVTPEVLMLLARAFARAELDPGRILQQAMMTAMEAQSAPIAAALTGADISDHFAELAAALNNDPFEIYAELATTAAAFPPEHHAAMAGALGLSLSGPRAYGGVLLDDATMGDGRRNANAADIRRALALYRVADAILLIGLAGLAARGQRV